MPQNGTRVFPVHNNIFKFGINGLDSTAEQMKTPANMESFTPSFNNTIEEWFAMDQEGWGSSMMTGKKVSIQFKGKRTIGDPANDYIAGLMLENGMEAQTQFEWTLPEVIKCFNDEQRRVRDEWRSRRAMSMPEEEYDKAMKSLMGFDQLNRLDGSGGGGGGGGDDEDNMPFDMEDEELLDSLTAKVIAIKKLFAEGFKIGFQSADLQAIRNHAESVRKSLAGIFTSGEVQTASRKFCEAFIKNLGKITGSLGSMGATVMENPLSTT